MLLATAKLVNIILTSNYLIRAHETCMWQLWQWKHRSSVNQIKSSIYNSLRWTNANCSCVNQWNELLAPFFSINLFYHIEKAHACLLCKCIKKSIFFWTWKTQMYRWIRAKAHNNRANNWRFSHENSLLNALNELISFIVSIFHLKYSH